MKNLAKYTSLIFFLSFMANASVTMVNTRVIFTGDEKEQTVQLINRESVPYLVQFWAEDKNFDDTNDFIPLPPVAKVSGKSTQSVRLKKNYENHNKVEELYYFNFLQLPASSSSSKNKILLVVKNQVKIFIRPSGLNKSLESSINDVKLTKSAGKMNFQNPSPYHMSIYSISVKRDKHWKVLKRNVLVKPESGLNVALPIKSSDKVKVEYVNDYGAIKYLVY